MTDGVEEHVFHPITSVVTRSGEPDENIQRNVAKRLNTDLPRLHHMPGYGKYKGPDPIALIAGGPSLKTTWDELLPIKTKVACGSSHDYLVSRGIIPDYAVACDPDPCTADYLRKPVKSCKYLIFSGCHDAVFNALDGHDVTIWNSAGIDPSHFRGEPVVQGGCTVTLRALNIFILLGYLNQHFFGLDSSFKSETENHAYDYKLQNKIFPVRVGGEGGKIFQSTKPWIAQAENFKEQVATTGHLFNPTIHGDGMIAEIMRIAKGEQ